MAKRRKREKLTARHTVGGAGLRLATALQRGSWTLEPKYAAAALLANALREIGSDALANALRAAIDSAIERADAFELPSSCGHNHYGCALAELAIAEVASREAGSPESLATLLLRIATGSESVKYRKPEDYRGPHAERP